MAIINVLLTDTFDTWRQKTNTLGTNQGDLANLDSSFAATDLVSALNEIKAGDDLTQLKLGDSTGLNVNRIRLGDSDDLQLYHDGTDSIITNTTGTLVVRSSAAGTIEFRDQSSQVLAQLNDNADVKLYHNATEKLATTATGITVSGDIATSDNTSGQLMIANGTNFVSTPVSGDATLAANGTLTLAPITSAKIADGTIATVDVADDAITRAKLASEVSLIIYDSAGTAVKTLYAAGA